MEMRERTHTHTKFNIQVESPKKQMENKKKEVRALRQEQVYSNARRGLDSSNNGTLPLAEGIKILGLFFKNGKKKKKT